jgi:hypothetical protein
MIKIKKGYPVMRQPLYIDRHPGLDSGSVICPHNYPYP